MKNIKRLLAFICMMCVFIESVYAGNRYISMILTYDYTDHKYNAEEVFVSIDGEKLTNLEMPPIILNNYTLVPAREVFEAVGATVEWKKDVEQVYVTYGSTLVVIPINSTKAYVNGVASTMQTAAKIINNKTMIPLRFVSTAVGFDIDWDSKTRIANIITKDITTETTTQATTKEQTTTTKATTTTETTTEITTSAEPVVIDKITLATANARDTITIEGSGPVYPVGVMSNDKSAFNITIPNSKLTDGTGNLGKATYIKEGYYYQNSSNVCINLSVIVNVGLSTVHYGNRTVITVDYAPENSGTEYSTDIEEFVIKNGSSINTNSIVHNDDYNNLKYTMTFSGNYSNIMSSKTYSVNSEYIDTIDVEVSKNKTTITFNEKKILAYDINKSGSDLIIKPVLPKDKYSKIIVLDAGHGGSDPGASGQGLIEKELTLNMLLKAKTLFEQDGTIKCYTTRSADVYPSFDDRTNLANEVGDAFVSIHINAASNESPKGTETYSLYPNDLGNGLTSYTLAEKILNNLLENLGTTNRKVKSENWIVLRQSTVPATLIEIGFITNSEDAAIMGSDSGQQAVAQAIYDAVKDLFNKYPPVR